jgi:hypothetical protein
MLNRYVGRNTDWEAEIKAAFTELSLHGHEMSEYERNVIGREIKRRQEELIPIIGAKVISEYKQSIEKFKAAEATIQAERTKEINRFDSSKYNAEFQAISSRIKMTLDHPKNINDATEKSVSKRLEEIYNEAIQSGDIHKQRAAVEILKDIPIVGSQQEERIRVNNLAKTAAAKEAEIRQTEGIVKAQQARHAALLELDERHEKLNKVSVILGLGEVTAGYANNPFSRAWKQAQRDPNTGEIKFYKETDPEVTGVYWKE